MSTPKVMGFDLGVTLSWAFGPPNAPPRVVAERLRRPDEDNMVAAGYLAFKLQRFFDHGARPDLIVFEQPWVQGQFANVAELFIGLKTSICIMCGFYGVRSVEVPSSTISKFCVGKGRWSKEQGGREQKKIAGQEWAVKKEFLRPEDLPNDGKADAIMAWYYGCHAVLKVPEEKWEMSA